MIRRRDVDRIGGKTHAVFEKHHRQSFFSFENLRQPGFVIRVAMSDHHECHAALFGNSGDERFQSLQSAGRSPNPDDRKIALFDFLHIDLPIVCSA